LKLVLDASVAIKWFAAEADSDQAIKLLDGHLFVAPDILPVEVASVLLRMERRREIRTGTATDALIEMDRIGCELLPPGPVLKSAAALASRHRLGLLDCLYLIVAQDRGLAVATFDRGMRQLARHLSIPLWSAEIAT
jgi:predicted nucleic acid-binding protein